MRNPFKRQRKIYRVLNAMNSQVIAVVDSNEMNTRQWLQTELNRLHGKIKDISPVHVDMTERLAEEVLDKMRGPLTISQQASDWLREQAPHHLISYTAPLGFSSTSGRVNYLITPEGTLQLELLSYLGESLWRGEFTPPDYRKGKTDE